MADYYPLIARAVAGLEKNTGDARRVLYERARAALVAQVVLRGLSPFRLAPGHRIASRNELPPHSIAAILLGWSPFESCSVQSTSIFRALDYAGGI